MSETCEGCRFFFQHCEAEGSGRCRRFPPAIAPVTDNGESQAHPEVFTGEWCGEWSPAVPAKSDVTIETLKAHGMNRQATRGIMRWCAEQGTGADFSALVADNFVELGSVTGYGAGSVKSAQDALRKLRGL